MFTKGKWERAIATEVGFKVLVIGGDDGVVADCQASWRNFHENEANAQLISASPDMYEALKDVIVWARSVWSEEKCQKELPKLIKALEKAEGVK